ncbi:hypothetical protein BGZ52_010908, partial [Haplosporangium bisporale]
MTTKRDVFIYGNVLTRQAFTHEDFSLDQNVIKRGSKDKALLQKLKMPIDQVEDPFKLKTLWLCIKPRQDILHPFLRNCPQLESIKIDDLFDRETHAQMPQIIAHSCPLLRGLDLRNAWEAGDAIRCSNQLGRFSQLQRVYIPCTDYRFVQNEAVAYATRTGAWADGRRSWTIEDVRRIMGRKSLRDSESRREDGGQVTETVPEATLIAKIAKSVMGWCRQWAPMFAPHLWRTMRLPSTVIPAKDRIGAILESKHWIRSVTVAAQHIGQVSSLGLITLQELVLYDQDFQVSYTGDPVRVDAVVFMVSSNKSLQSLAINLNHYNYESKQLTPSLMLAIARHPSLSKLTWHIPDDLDTRAFVKCLLHVCHTSIQELHLATKRNVSTYGFRFNTCPAFTHEDFNNDQNVIKRGS